VSADPDPGDDASTPASGATASDPAPVRCVGLSTRALAIVIDAALIGLVAVVAEVGAALVISLLHLPKQVKGVLVAIAAVIYILWTIGYFVGFWSTTGQTPGARVMRIRVVTSKGARLGPKRALVRLVGMVLAALPLFAGYLLILFDDKRRGFQDRFAGTLVVEAPELSIAAQRRLMLREAAARERTGEGSSDSGDDGGRPVPDAGLEPERLPPDSADRNGASGQTQDDIGKETSSIWQR
jgi:uncharacterized RDD family membrane protein YckC